MLLPLLLLAVSVAVVVVVVMLLLLLLVLSLLFPDTFAAGAAAAPLVATVSFFLEKKYLDSISLKYFISFVCSSP